MNKIPYIDDYSSRMVAVCLFDDILIIPNEAIHS